MAYVRKTETLVAEITAKVRQMKTEAVSNYEVDHIAEGSPIWEEARASVVNAAYHDAPELQGKLPKSWERAHERISMTFNAGTDKPVYKTFLVASRQNPIKLPPNISSSYYSSDVEVHEADCTDKMRTWLNEANERNTKRQAIIDQFNNIESQLRAFMGEHASLNSALKEMPEMEMYVPDKFLAKMRAASKPRKKAEDKVDNADMLGIDREALTTLAIAHRLTQ